jgi:hypothetical protein
MEDPRASVILQPSALNSASIRDQSRLPLTGSAQMACNVFECLLFTTKMISQLQTPIQDFAQWRTFGSASMRGNAKASTA